MSKRFSASAFVKDSTVISALSFLGVVAAFLLDVVIAAKYGLGYRTDAFFIAVGMPQLVWSILASSSTRVLTPVFTQLVDEKGDAETWRFFSSLCNLSIIVLSVFATLGVLLSPLLLRIIGAGLQATAWDLAVSLSRVLFVMLIPAGVIQIMKAALNARGEFSTPAAAGLLQYATIVAVIVLLEQSLGIIAVAVGYVCSMIVQVLVLAAAVYWKGGTYRPLVDLTQPELTKTGRLMVPPLSGEVLAQSTAVIERALASFLPAGSVSALAYAGRILRALDIMFLNSVVVAVLPRLSSLATAGDFPEFKRLVSLSLKVTWGVTIPLTAGILALNVPIISLMFQRGAFDQEAASLTGGILAFYIVGFPFLAMIRILVSSFYSMQDTKTPFYIRAGMMGVNLGGDLVLIRLLGVSALALATSLTYAVSSLWVTRILRRKIGPLNLRVNRYLVRTGVAALIMGTTAFALRHWLEGAMGAVSLTGLLVQVVVVGTVACATYLLALALLRLEEFQLFVHWVRTRLPLQSA